MNNRFFTKIDNFMGKRTSSEKFIIFLSIFLLIIYYMWITLHPISENKMVSAKQELQVSQTKLNKQIAYLKSKTQGDNDKLLVKKLKKIVNDMSVEYDTLVLENSAMDDKMKKLSSKLSKDNLWTILIDQYSSIAKKHNIKVNHIKNSISKVSLKSFSQFIYFNMNVTGKFKNIVKFLDDIEKSSTFVEINNLDLNSSTKLTLDFDIIIRELKY